ncbi:hypothetical protein DPMN_118083 [Dreissena polymorpha]|uniref:Uncharacterized protein n=2 Tax=Dreissena polymorpha TaxID=45954 RepID=A0A9D4GG85_DREPO|nr:hypothetical protein DPMN_118083 [Dreissena polymorpha]
MVEENIEFQFHCGDVELCIFPHQFCSSDSYTCKSCSNSICAEQNIPLQCLYNCRKRIRVEDTCHIQAWHVVLFCAVTAVATSVITGFVCVLRQKETCRRTDDDNQTDEDNNLIGNHERGEYCRSKLAGIQPTDGNQQTTIQKNTNL